MTSTTLVNEQHDKKDVVVGMALVLGFMSATILHILIAHPVVGINQIAGATIVALIFATMLPDTYRDLKSHNTVWMRRGMAFSLLFLMLSGMGLPDGPSKQMLKSMQVESRIDPPDFLEVYLVAKIDPIPQSFGLNQAELVLVGEIHRVKALCGSEVTTGSRVTIGLLEGGHGPAPWVAILQK